MKREGAEQIKKWMANGNKKALVISHKKKKPQGGYAKAVLLSSFHNWRIKLRCYVQSRWSKAAQANYNSSVF